MAFNTPAGGNYGTVAFVVDSQNPGTVYLGTSAQGVYKTTDCGASWIHVNTGANGTMLDDGRQGTMVIDPTDPNVLYADARYGPGGVFKSTNGGVDWQQILPPDIYSVFNFGGFTEWIAMDPTNHLHLTVAPHFQCTGSHAPNCLLETEDGGGTWRVIDGTPEAQELGGQVMLNHDTWLYTQPQGQLWLTTNQGASWTSVATQTTTPYLYQASNKEYFLSGGSNVLQSSDGMAWQPIMTSPGAASLAGGGSSLFVTASNIFSANSQYYSKASTAAPGTWSTVPNPPMPEGGWMIGYDATHQILYSSNFNGGFWRVVTGQ